MTRYELMNEFTEPSGYDGHHGRVCAAKASPVDMRKALVFADELKKIGVLFVPMPVLNSADRDALYEESFRRMGLIEKQAELETC